MQPVSTLLGALLITAPLIFCQQPAQSPDPRLRVDLLSRLTLDETPDQVRALMGPPSHIGAFGPNYVTWHYQIDLRDHHEFSHLFCFSEPGQKLIGVTRNFEEATNVDRLFPPEHTEVHHWPDDRKPQFSIRVRRLSGDRVLMAMGVSKAGQTTNQLVLMRLSSVGNFHPWLAPRLSSR